MPNLRISFLCLGLVASCYLYAHESTGRFTAESQLSDVVAELCQGARFDGKKPVSLRGYGASYSDVFLLGGLDEAKARLIVAFTLSRTRSMIQGNSKIPEAQNTSRLLDEVTPSLERLVQMAKGTSGNREINAAAFTIETKGNKTAFLVLGPEFEKNFLRAPLYFQSILIHEFQHLNDFFNEHPTFANEGIKESRGHFAQSQFLKLLPESVIQKSPDIKAAVEAASEGPNSAKWKNYVSDYRHEDQPLIERMMKYQNETLPKLTIKETHKPFTELLIPIERDLLKETESLKGLDLNGIATGKVPLEQETRRTLYKLSSYLKLRDATIPLMKRRIATLGKKSPDPEDVSGQLTHMQQLKELNSRMARIVNHEEFTALLNGAPKIADEVTSAETLNEISKWLKDDPQGVLTAEIVKKIACPK